MLTLGLLLVIKGKLFQSSGTATAKEQRPYVLFSLFLHSDDWDCEPISKRDMHHVVGFSVWCGTNQCTVWYKLPRVQDATCGLEVVVY